MTEIETYRKKIDEIDQQLTQLFEQRMETVKKVGQYKKAKQLPIYNENREADVISKNQAYLVDAAYQQELALFFQGLMAISKNLQTKNSSKEQQLDFPIVPSPFEKFEETIKVGCYGAEGSFSEEAMLDYFGSIDQPHYFTKFEDVFSAIEQKDIDYGVVPIENSSTGAITKIYDLLTQYDFYIVGEQYIGVDQHLVGLQDTEFANVAEVYSHPQGFEQSTLFLKQHPKWQWRPYHSTSESAKLVSELKDLTKVAISSKRAADRYNLTVLQEKINDQHENSTRFIVLSKKLETSVDCSKISVVFSIEHQVGTLYRLLHYFAENKLNLIKIESRPIVNEPWHYLFYIDFEGNVSMPKVQQTLQMIQQTSSFFKVIGAYQAAEKTKNKRTVK